MPKYLAHAPQPEFPEHHFLSDWVPRKWVMTLGFAWTTWTVCFIGCHLLVLKSTRMSFESIQFRTYWFYENTVNTKGCNLDTIVCDVCSPALTVLTSKQLQPFGMKLVHAGPRRKGCMTMKQHYKTRLCMWVTFYDPWCCQKTLFLQIWSGPSHELFETFCGWALLSAEDIWGTQGILSVCSYVHVGTADRVRYLKVLINKHMS